MFSVLHIFSFRIKTCQWDYKIADNNNNNNNNNNKGMVKCQLQLGTMHELEATNGPVYPKEKGYTPMFQDISNNPDHKLYN